MKSSFDLLWKHPEQGKRGPKPELSLTRVLDAAVDIAGADGLDKLSMSRLADRLNVTTMAVYRYVSGKDQLIELMSDHALGEPPRLDAAKWRARIIDWAHAELDRLRAHPWLLEVVDRRVTIGPNWAAWLNAALESLAVVRLKPRERTALLMLIDAHVRTTAAQTTGVAATPEWAAQFHRLLEAAAEDPRYAALSQTAAEGGFEQPSAGEFDAFTFGLNRILEGLERKGKH